MPNAQCPMPNAPCPMPHAPCPMPNAPCPMPHAQFSIRQHEQIGDRGNLGRSSAGCSIPGLP